MLSRLRNIFFAGLLLLVPMVITVAILRFLFGMLDDFSQPLMQLYVGRPVPYAGAVLTALIILALGSLSNILLGQRLVNWFEGQIGRIPGVRNVYSTTRQVVRGFTNTEGMNFKRAVFLRREDGNLMLGFVTRELVLNAGDLAEPSIAVFVPTNHIYFGDIVIVPLERVLDVDLSLEDAFSAVLSCGGSLPDAIAITAAAKLTERGIFPRTKPPSAKSA